MMRNWKFSLGNLHRWRRQASVFTLMMLIAAAPAKVFPQSASRPGQTDSMGSELEFEFDGMEIGIAEYEEGPTGTTVFYFPEGVKGAADVRGGSPGTVNATSVALGYEDRFIDAVVFSGGSWYGLSAATGVANGVKDLKLAAGEPDHVSGVLGAIVYDVGWRRFTRVTPDDALGRLALEAAVPNRFPLGARGAGRFVMQGIFFSDYSGSDSFANWMHSGQGGAFKTVGPTKIAVFTVVNAVGAVVDRDGRLVRCHRNVRVEQCPLVSDLLSERLGQLTPDSESKGGPTNNTTLTLVVTNQKLPFWALQRLAVQVHTSMGRAIQPFSTEDDGDVVYAVTTDQVENPDMSAGELAAIASELAWDAVLSSVPELPQTPSEVARPPGTFHLAEFEGHYDFPNGGSLTVAREATGLVARYAGPRRMYFVEGTSYALLPAEGGAFIIDTPALDVIRFETDGDRVTGLTINPGPWPARAVRAD